MTVGLAYITWRGIESHNEVQFTVTHGLEPSKITINIPPDQNMEVGGTLTLRQGSTEIPFYDCRADLVDVYQSADGLRMWTVTILDRRWKWKFGQISGYYNVRVEKTIRQGTEQNIQKLMKLCLEAMGEKDYDLSTVPTDIFPEIEWDYTLPAEALAKLADLIGYRVVFQIRRNRVAILKHGEGRTLKQENATDYAATFDPPESPSDLRFIGGRTLWELDIPLQAVAQDTNHVVKLLNDPSLSYHPKESMTLDGVQSFWWNYDDEFGNIVGNEKVSLLVGETSLKDFVKGEVYRKYRIDPVGITLPHPGGDIKIQSLQQLLPLLRERLATYPTEFGLRPKPAVVWGQFEGYSAAKENNIDDKPKASSSGGKAELPDGSPPKGLVYPDGWNLDVETGIVTFDKPLRRFFYKEIKFPRKILSTGGTQSPYTQLVGLSLPAIVWLRTSFGCRGATTRAWRHYEIQRILDPKAKTKPLYTRRDDIPLSYLIGSEGKPISVKDATLKDYQKAATFYLNQLQKTLEVRDPVAVTYPYLRLEDLDGAIQQVTWTINNRGGFTKVSRNREEPVLGYSYADQRLFQQITARLGLPTTARAEADRADRKLGPG